MRKSQKEIQKKYEDKQKKREMSHSRVWVPTIYREQLYTFARQLRDLYKQNEA